MSFIRFIYNTFFRKFLDRSFTLNDFYSIVGFINDIKSGKVVDSYEAAELRGSQELAGHIDNKDDLLPSIINLINDKKRGSEVKQSLLEHRFLIHTMFYNEGYMLNQLSKIIHELENTVKLEEERRGSLKVITPQTGYGLYKK